MLYKRIVVILLILISSSSASYIFFPEFTKELIVATAIFLTSVKTHLFTIAKLLKTKAIAAFLASKVQILLYIKGLTLVQFGLLTIKRFFIDHVLSKWIQDHITVHIAEPIKKFTGYIFELNWRYKIKRNLKIVLPAGAFLWILYITDSFTSMALYLELKVIVIGFFKFLWLSMSKIIGMIYYFFSNYIAGTWISPILEIFALSYILSLIEKMPLIGPPLHKLIDSFINKISGLFTHARLLDDKYISPKLKKHLGDKVKSFAEKLDSKIDISKTENELMMIEELQKSLSSGNIDDYISFSKHNLYRIKDKDVLYNEINRLTKDNIDIVGYASINSNGYAVTDSKGKVDKGEKDSYTNDVFILEGLSSSHKTGSNSATTEINKFSFWVLNSSPFDFEIIVHGKERKAPAKKITLFSPKKEIDYKKGDVLVKDRRGETVPIRYLKKRLTKKEKKKLAKKRLMRIKK